MSAVLTDLLDDVQEQAVEQILDVLTAVWETMLGPDGSTYGDINPGPAGRIERFVDLANRGVLDVLETISPPTYERLINEYVHDVASSPLIRSA